MNYTCDFCTIYRIPKIQEKLNTLYPNFDQKIPYTWIKMARDTVYPKPLAGPEEYGTDRVYGRFAIVLFANFWSRFAYVLMCQFRNCFCLISGWKNEVYTCLSRFFGSLLSEGSTEWRKHSAREGSAALVSLLSGTTEMLAKRLVGPGGGGNSHMKQTGMLAVSLRGVNVGFWSCWGCSGQSANILSRHGLV